MSTDYRKQLPYIPPPDYTMRGLTTTNSRPSVFNMMPLSQNFSDHPERLRKAVPPSHQQRIDQNLNQNNKSIPLTPPIKYSALSPTRWLRNHYPKNHTPAKIHVHESSSSSTNSTPSLRRPMSGVYTHSVGDRSSFPGQVEPMKPLKAKLLSKEQRVKRMLAEQGVPVLPPMNGFIQPKSNLGLTPAYIKHLENHRKFDTMNSYRSCENCQLCQQEMFSLKSIPPTPPKRQDSLSESNASEEINEFTVEKSMNLEWKKQ